MIINIDTTKLPDYYGEIVTFEKGLLMVSGYDGMTELNKEEAKELSKALQDYIDA